MPVKKLSVALQARTAKAAETSARRRGLSLSAWLNDAAENALSIEAGLDAVAEWEAEHGRLDEAELAAADRILDKHALGGAGDRAQGRRGQRRAS